ncbi:hypothetical protein DMA11_06335 [Marinilabiliaceae bacterium JC017]|nr:hypothetical protein DMA11_06335 [Marinilabiliaceae bacterium JC017]
MKIGEVYFCDWFWPLCFCFQAGAIAEDLPGHPNKSEQKNHEIWLPCRLFYKCHGQIHGVKAAR